LASFGVTAGLTRTVALGSLVSAVVLVVACLALGAPALVSGLAGVAAALIFVRHASNIRRLVERRGNAAAESFEAKAASPESGAEDARS